MLLKNKPFSLNSFNPKKEESDVCRFYVEKFSVTGFFSRFLIPKIGLLRANLLSLSLIGFSYILFVYGLFGNHPHIFPLSIFSVICGFAIMSLERYYMFRTCQNCGKELAYVMIMAEIISNYTEKKITSYYRCKYCGHERVKVEIFDLGCDSPP